MQGGARLTHWTPETGYWSAGVRRLGAQGYSLWATYSQLSPSPGKASGRESCSVEMRVDGVAMAVPVDPSGGHGSWPESRYHLLLQDPV